MASVDKKFAQMVAYKRVFTGCAGFIGGVVLIVLLATRQAQLNQRTLISAAIALALFFGGGAWSMRDGLRVLRELRALRG